MDTAIMSYTFSITIDADRVQIGVVMSIANTTRKITQQLGVVDNDRFTLIALCTILKRTLEPQNIKIMWTASSGLEALSLCAKDVSTPDIMLVDISMEDISGIRVCRSIRHDNPEIKLLTMTSFTLESYARQAAFAGTQGIVAKNDPKEVCNAIQSVLSGNCWNPLLDSTPFETAKQSYDRLHNQSNTDLSVRETQIVDLCARGYTYKEIARQLNISEATIRTYIERAREKFHASNRVELIAMWLDERR